MNNWNRVLAALNATFGIPGKAASKVKKLRQGFDNKTQEHVIWIEYRIRSSDAPAPRTDRQPAKTGGPRRQSLLRELLSRPDDPGSPA